jgi:uncharacterized protein (DUF2164 family)
LTHDDASALPKKSEMKNYNNKNKKCKKLVQRFAITYKRRAHNTRCQTFASNFYVGFIAGAYGNAS